MKELYDLYEFRNVISTLAYIYCYHQLYPESEPWSKMWKESTPLLQLIHDYFVKHGSVCSFNTSTLQFDNFIYTSSGAVYNSLSARGITAKNLKFNTGIKLNYNFIPDRVDYNTKTDIEIFDMLNGGSADVKDKLLKPYGNYGSTVLGIYGPMFRMRYGNMPLSIKRFPNKKKLLENIEIYKNIFSQDYKGMPSDIVEESLDKYTKKMMKDISMLVYSINKFAGYSLTDGWKTPMSNISEEPDGLTCLSGQYKEYKGICYNHTYNASNISKGSTANFDFVKILNIVDSLSNKELAEYSIFKMTFLKDDSAYITPFINLASYREFNSRYPVFMNNIALDTIFPTKAVSYYEDGIFNLDPKLMATYLILLANKMYLSMNIFKIEYNLCKANYIAQMSSAIGTEVEGDYNLIGIELAVAMVMSGNYDIIKIIRQLKTEDDGYINLEEFDDSFKLINTSNYNQVYKFLSKHYGVWEILSRYIKNKVKTVDTLTFSPDLSQQHAAIKVLERLIGFYDVFDKNHDAIVKAHSQPNQRYQLYIREYMIHKREKKDTPEPDLNFAKKVREQFVSIQDTAHKSLESTEGIS